MSNGPIEEAEIAAILSGDTVAVNTYLVTGLHQLTDAVNAMRTACDVRGRTCPGLLACGTSPSEIASEAARVAAETALTTAETARTAAVEASRVAKEAAQTLADTASRTNFMWLIGSKIGYVVIAVIVAAITLGMRLLWPG